MFFTEDGAQDVIVLKHNCYSPPLTHSHKFFEMLYVFEGSCEHILDHARFSMREGELCIVAPETEHFVSVFDESIVINFLIRSSTFETMFSNLLKGNHVLSSFFLNNIYSKKSSRYITVDTEKDAALKEMLLEIMLEYENKELYYYEIMNSMLVTFFGRLLRSYEKNFRLPPAAKAQDERSLILIQFIRENYRSVTINDIADRFHYSENYATKLIKSSTGYTFTQLHKKIRMHKAARLLEDTDLSVQNICDEVGYLNPEHFIRTFKKEYLLNPSEYRKIHMNKTGNIRPPVRPARSPQTLS